MDKPLSVKYEELKKNLADAINESGLAAFMVEPILKDYLFEIRDVAKRQYNKDLLDYNVARLQEEKGADRDGNIESEEFRAYDADGNVIDNS